MKRRVRISLIGMLASLFFCAGVAMTEDTPANTTTPALWTHDFKEKLIKVEALPGTYLGVVSGPLKHKKKEPYKATRWLLDGQAGGVVWSGPEEASEIVAGDPHPVLVQQDKEALTLRALSRDGAAVWSRTLPGVSLSIAVDVENKELILLSAAASWLDGSVEQPAQLQALSLADGATRWEADLGPLTLPVVTPANVMALAPRTIWLFAGERLIALSRDGMKVLFNQAAPAAWGVAREKTKKKNQTIASPVLRWDPSDDWCALALEGNVAFLSAEKGLVWTNPVDKSNAAPDAVAVTDRTVIAGFRLVRKERSLVWVGAYDREKGGLLWEYENRDGALAKWDRVAAPPIGMAVGRGRVALAIGGDVVGLDEASGKRAYRIDLSKQEYTYAKELRRAGDRFVLFGKFHIRAHDLSSGELKWKLADVGDPIDYAQRNQKYSAGMMAIGFQAAASMQEFSANSMRSLATKKLPGRTGSTHKDYFFSPSARGQLESAAKQAASNSAFYSKAGSAGIDFLGLSNWTEVRSLSGDPRRHVQPRVVDTGMMAFMPFRLASALLLDLDSGTYRESGSFRAKSACITALCVDVPGRRLYYANHKLAPACTQYKDIQAYPLPEELLKL